MSDVNIDVYEYCVATRIQAVSVRAVLFASRRNRSVLISKVSCPELIDECFD